MLTAQKFGQYKSIQEGLKEPEKVRHLEIDGVKEAALLHQISSFKNLSVIYAQNLSEFPVQITFLKNLRILTIEKSSFQKLPEGFGQLENLEVIIIDAELDELPDSFKQLTKLEELNLSNNQFSKVPNAICSLGKLKNLKLSKNLFSAIDDCFYNIESLENLDLSGNKLEILSDKISSLKKLKMLTLSENQIKTLPVSLVQITSLEIVDLSGNPLDYEQIDKLASSAKQILFLTD